MGQNYQLRVGCKEKLFKRKCWKIIKKEAYLTIGLRAYQKSHIIDCKFVIELIAFKYYKWHVLNRRYTLCRHICGNIYKMLDNAVQVISMGVRRLFSRGGKIFTRGARGAKTYYLPKNALKILFWSAKCPLLPSPTDAHGYI